jgi:hypothetical protein
MFGVTRNLFVQIADLVRRGLLAGSSWPKRQIDQF